MQTVRRTLVSGVILVSASLFLGCGSTTITSTWKDPQLTQLTFDRVLVIALARDSALRRSAEDELASKIERAEAVPSYTILEESELADDTAVQARAREAGFDGIIVMRVASVEKEATWVPGAMGPYYGYGGWAAYDPGYVDVDTFVRVETNIYSVADNKLVWAAASRTVDPSSVRSLVDATARAVAEELKEEGLTPG